MNPDPALDTASRRLVFSVSQLNREVRGVLEGGFPLVWVEGELSNLARPSSGHLYFTLKDSAAQVRCAMWRTRSKLLRFRPADGSQVLVRARISLYEPRGEYQLIVEHMEEAGDGALQRAFEALKQRLAAEGLFDTARKRPLPSLPRRIGVVTSPSGAAIRDVLSVLRRRFPALEVLLYPVPVQGPGAAEAIVAALRLADRRRDCDVLLLVRGGGSLEDLQAFNEEGLARAIAACSIPIVSGVGHEVDVTIADFVADVRAPTPTGAAELVTPDQADWLRTLAQREGGVLRAIRQKLSRLSERVAGMARQLRLLHPGQRLTQQAQRLDELEQRLHAHWRARLRAQASRLAEAQARLQQHTPRHRIERGLDRTAALAQRLRGDMQHRLQDRHARLGSLVRALSAVSPLATLARGYAIVTTPDGRVVTRASEVKSGTEIEARLARGRLYATVTRRRDD